MGKVRWREARLRIVALGQAEPGWHPVRREVEKMDFLSKRGSGSGMASACQEKADDMDCGPSECVEPLEMSAKIRLCTGQENTKQSKHCENGCSYKKEELDLDASVDLENYKLDKENHLDRGEKEFPPPSNPVGEEISSLGESLQYQNKCSNHAYDMVPPVGGTTLMTTSVLLGTTPAPHTGQDPSPRLSDLTTHTSGSMLMGKSLKTNPNALFADETLSRNRPERAVGI